MTKEVTLEMERSMEKAVKWLCDRGGSGVINRFNRVLAGGDQALNITTDVWLRCIWSGRLRIDYEARRIYAPEAEIQRRTA